MVSHAQDLERLHWASDDTLQPVRPRSHCLQVMESHALPRGSSGNLQAWSGLFRHPHPQLLQGRRACSCNRLPRGCSMCRPSSCTPAQWRLKLLLRAASISLLLIREAGSRWLQARMLELPGRALLQRAVHQASIGALDMFQSAAMSMRRVRAWGQESVRQASIWQRAGCSILLGKW